jgi:hypothetical protein
MASGEMSDEEFFAFNVSWIGCALPWLCDGAVFGTCIDWRGYPTVHAASVKAGLARCIRETGASSTRFKDSRPGCWKRNMTLTLERPSDPEGLRSAARRFRSSLKPVG